MEAEEKNKKRKLDLDWTKLLSREPGDEGPPPPLVVITIEPQPSPSKSDSMGGGGDQGKDEFSENLPDHKLDEMIQRQQRNLEHLGSKLPDKGKKIRDRLERLEEEKKRRTLSRAKMDAAGCEKPTQLSSSDIVGELLNNLRNIETDCGIVNTFDKELSILNRCERKKTRCNGEFSQRERQKVRVSPRRISLKHPRKPSFVDQKCRTALLYSLCDTDDDLPSISKKNAFQVRPSNNSRRRKGQTVVLVDEEEPQLVQTTELEVKLPNCKKDARIYYPSRDDPESVEICFGDIDSLAPETFLTSQIMNFYIRYLQQQASPTNRAICDYHFFNTYFYQKLKEAVSYKGSDKDALFIKFRRWWKGVNIFQKAYVLIPINEDFHWSLVIICIPDKEDESGPIILHLDSLGLHCSRSVFKNIKSYMREEWNYLNQEVAPSDLPIADKIWENLPRRIEEKTIAVPQQKNDYDCGLFVLFFMERFIEEAPERLKKKDLAMFGKQWFRPEEASSLRVKIRNLLIEQFRSASENMGGSQSSPSLS
ncbi:Ulp1 protease family [Theobroma cacao]|nr:Ulp1 protease family [Theobroma cacao]